MNEFLLYYKLLELISQQEVEQVSIGSVDMTVEICIS